MLPGSAGGPEALVLVREVAVTAVKRGHLPAIQTIDAGADPIDFIVLKLGPPPLAIRGRPVGRRHPVPVEPPLEPVERRAVCGQLVLDSLAPAEQQRSVLRADAEGIGNFRLILRFNPEGDRAEVNINWEQVPNEESRITLGGAADPVFVARFTREAFAAAQLVWTSSVDEARLPRAVSTAATCGSRSAIAGAGSTSTPPTWGEASVHP